MIFYRYFRWLNKWRHFQRTRIAVEKRARPYTHRLFYETYIEENRSNITGTIASLTLFRGVCKFAHPYLDVTNRKIWGATGAPNFFTFNMIILDVFCENLVCLTHLLQILQLFFEEDPKNIWSEPCEMVKSMNVL